MKSRCFMLLFGIMAASVALLTPHATNESSGQQRATVYTTNQSGLTVQQPFAPPSGYVTSSFFQRGNSRFSKELNAALLNLKKADTDDKKADATNALETALNDYFDEDMKSREKQLEELRNKLDEMEDHLDKRRKAKEDIVELQLKTFVNEANGMGFFGESPTRGNWWQPSPPTLQPAPPKAPAARRSTAR